MKQIIAMLAGLLCAASVWAQTDSIGVYAVRGSALDRVEILNYSATKISKGFMKAKARLEFSGAASANQFDGSATFRLYFGAPSPYETAKYYMFTPSYSAKDFGVGRFEVKDGKRYLSTATVSIVGSKLGADGAEDLNIETTKLRDNVYEITVSGPAGQYCIMPVINGTAGYTGVFDFSLK